ncbi:YbaN family protein [Magnetospirillum sp. SS-4]|uniref:YbaN family protein n=1 Tax=Magnetospirillum sp. SS-4 TaxID=2681465 RepID=UPI00137E7C17|nr:YbaN family protein [Magnetospirillum sp. SS-4]CAA7612945.1 conserved membrane hypothetical protein [Magnetospirillum sp. SS-4]
MPEVERPRGPRLVLFGLGWLFVGLGLVGVVLPVMPTTPFMLVALWCFANSSRRFHAWLFHHPLFGPPLQAWEQDRVIPLGAKIVAIASMAASMIYVAGFTETHWALLATMGTSCAAGAAFILSCPHRKPAPIAARTPERTEPGR